MVVVVGGRGGGGYGGSCSHDVPVREFTVRPAIEAALKSLHPGHERGEVYLQHQGHRVGRQQFCGVRIAGQNVAVRRLTRNPEQHHR